jgi:hypothetical protein
MKKLTFFTAMFIACTCFAQVPNYVSTNGLVGWWPFNGNANDESGNGNNGTVNGATLTSDRNGVSNKAYFFDGINNRIQILLNNALINNTTISAWYFSSNTTGGPFVHIGHDNGGSPYCDGYDIGKGGSSLNNSGNDIISGFSCVGYYDSNVSGQINQWNHVVLSKSNNQIYMYLNGTIIFTSSISNSVAPSPFIFFASTSSGFSTLYNGKLDDIGVWDRVLTQQEIKNLYDGVYNLPVELAQFSATCSGNTTNINWQTATEHNSAYFEVLNSRDGENWNSLTTVNAAGNSSEAINYSISDNTDATTVYYKLNQVDKDGKSQEYGPISANCNENTSLFITPNPTNGEFNLIGMEHFGTITSLEVKDATGKVVKVLDPTTSEFSCVGLKTGIYFLNITSGSKQEVVKIIKE